jgi:hypothetical protein
MKQKGGKQSYTDECTGKERMEIIWLKAGNRQLGGIRRGFERGSCPLCLGEEVDKHILLNALKRKNGEKNLYAINC